MTPRVLGLVFVCGAAGSLCRWALQLLADGSALSAAGMTLTVNTLGVFAMASLSRLTAEGSPARRAAVNAGFFGGFTSFSAVMLLTVSARGLAEALGGLPAPAVGLGYLGLSLALAWLAAGAGHRVSSARLPHLIDRRRRSRA